MNQVIPYFESLLNAVSHPLYLALILISISFLFEDVAAATGVALASSGKLSWAESFFWVVFGIAFGDYLLYVLGAYCRKIPLLKRRYIDGKDHSSPLKTNMQLAGAIFISRVTPGLRLFTYVYMGFKKISLPKFLFFVTIAVLIWTSSLYLISVLFGQVIAATFGIPVGFATAIPLLVLALLSFIWSQRMNKS